MELLNNFLNRVANLLQRAKTPAQSVNKYQLYVGSINRVGLSPTEIASEIIAKQSELGIPVGAMPNGEPNLTEAMIAATVEILIKHLVTNAKIEIAIPAGITVTAAGANAGGAIVVQGATTDVAKGVGVIK